MIPLFKPYMPELPEMDSILHSGCLSYGSYSKQFEDLLRDYFNTPYLMVTSSFSLAVSVVLSTLKIRSGDEVIASPMACLVSTQPYLANGLHVRWADIDPHSGTLCPASVKDRITSKTKAIVHNHYCGYPGFIDEINAIGKEKGIPVIDDGIECFGSVYKGNLIGNCGTDVTIFSLSAVRFCNCIEGGIVIFKEKELFERALLVRDCGIDRTKFRDELGEINPDCDISIVGYCATMSNINGYIGLNQMRVISSLLKAHRKQALIWDDKMRSNAEYTPIKRDDCVPNYWVYGLLSERKLETIKKFRELGYYASGVHMRNDLYSAFEKQDIKLPGVDDFYSRFVALPCGWWME